MAIRDALGIIETKGFAPLVIAADAAVKSANVELLEWRKVGGGYVSFVIEGDVAAVKSSIEAGIEAGSKVGEVTSQLIIPRPVDDIDVVLKD
jgi:ethanolamine utilization protein EutM